MAPLSPTRFSPTRSDLPNEQGASRKRSFRPGNLALSILCLFALVGVAFTAQAAGIVGTKFEEGRTFIVMVDDAIVGNYPERTEARQAARVAKVANPDAYVGYFGTKFFEAQLTETPAVPAPEPPTQSGNGLPTRLLGVDDLEYQGSFRVPLPTGNSSADGLRYVGTGLAYNPARDSLFITGHDHHQLTAEITVPLPAVEQDLADLPRASFIRAPEDATDGNLADQQDAPDVNVFSRVGGYLVDGDQLVVSAFNYYDAANEQVRSHLSTDVNLGAAGDMTSLSDETPARWLGGGMAHIPEQWQPAFGGDPWLTGLSGISIAGNSSVGPSAATFSPASLQGEDPATLVLGYSLAEALDGDPAAQSDLWNLTSAPRGMVFPKDTASVLYFGLHGTGPYCYGIRDNCGGDTFRPGPSPHADPYRTQIWAYDAADMAAVFNGERTPQSLQPYLATGFDLPYFSEMPEVVGVAYDDATGRIFLAEALIDDTQPLIHVYTIGG